jgi:hypothetical protein
VKPHLIPIAIIIMSLLFAACTTQNSSTIETASTIATNTISIEQITAAATFRRTLPPSFTPTFTPRASDTPSITPTPSDTPPPTTVPEAALCEEFVVGVVPPITPQGILLLVSLSYRVVNIKVILTYVETGEVIAEGDAPGGITLQLQFNANDLPYDGEYFWEMFLYDATRSNMCPQEGTFTIEKRDFSAESTAEATAELTIEAIEVRAELTEEVTAEGA